MRAIGKGVAPASVAGRKHFNRAGTAGGGVGCHHCVCRALTACRDHEVCGPQRRVRLYEFHGVNPCERCLVAYGLAKFFFETIENINVAFEYGADPFGIVPDLTGEFEGVRHAPERRPKAHALHKARDPVGAPLHGHTILY